MNQNKSRQQGFAITAIVAIVSLVSLVISGTKVATHVYEKNETEKISQQFDEQAQHLAERAKDMGESGDEAVRESLRLNQAAKDVREHGTVVYQQKMIGEAVNLTKSLVISQGVGAATEGIATGLGATAKTAKELSQASGIILDADGIEQELQQAEKTSGEPIIETKEDKELYDLIKGSRSNVDDFNMAQVKAITDEVINMRKDLGEMGNEIEEWIAIREQAIKDLETAAYHRRLNQRELSRLAVLENDDLNQMIRQDFDGEQTPIDVVRELSGHSLEEWEKIQEKPEEQIEETQKPVTDKKITGRLPQKSLSKEKVLEALIKAKEDLGWAYYDPPKPNQDWVANINKYPPAGEMWAYYITIKYIPDKGAVSPWGIFDGWNRNTDEEGSQSLDIIPEAHTFCHEGGSGGELQIYLQNDWFIRVYKRGTYSCEDAIEYLKTFWKYL